MSLTRVLLVSAVLAAPVAGVQAGAGQAASDELVPLFDGKSLDTFEQHGGKAKYSLEDGMIVGTTVPNTPNSFLCTKKHYGDFILEYEFKIDPQLNSGVQRAFPTRFRQPNRRLRVGLEARSRH